MNADIQASLMTSFDSIFKGIKVMPSIHQSNDRS